MWCGTGSWDVDPESWVVDGPGYGNGWDAALEFSAPVSPGAWVFEVALDFHFHYETEPDYDFLSVQYDSAGSWVTVYRVSGTNKGPSGFEYPGVQPEMLVVHANGHRGGRAEIDFAFNQLGYREGIHYDSYTVLAAGEGVGNRIGNWSGGNGAIPIQLVGYSFILYQAGDLEHTAVSSWVWDKQKGNDLVVLAEWQHLRDVQHANRAIALFGSGLADCIAGYGPEGLGYLGDLAGVEFLGSDLGEVTSSLSVVPVGNRFDESFVALAPCSRAGLFDRIDAIEGSSVRGHAFAPALGEPTYPDFAASVLYQRWLGRYVWATTITFPFGFQSVGSNRATLLQEILQRSLREPTGLVYDFETGTLEGWTKSENFYGNLINPGGSLLAEDTQAGEGGIEAVAPPGWIEDAIAAGSVYWEEYLYQGNWVTRAQIVGQDGTWYEELPEHGPPNVVGEWRSRYVDFDPSRWQEQWYLCSGTASFEDVLANPAMFRFDMESGTSTGLESEIDNIVVCEVTFPPPGGPPTSMPAPRPPLSALSVHPNPFNPSVTIAFELGRAGRTTARIYDLRGRLVKVLVDEFLAAGPQRLQWHAMDDRDQRVSSGIYLLELQARDVREVRKLALVK